MAFVALSLVLSWASLGAGTAAAVVRTRSQISSPLLIYFLLCARVCVCLIGPSGNLTIPLRCRHEPTGLGGR